MKALNKNQVLFFCLIYELIFDEDDVDVDADDDDDNNEIMV